MTQARRVTEALLSTAQHSTKVIYLQQDLNSKDCGESIVKITKYLQRQCTSSSHQFIPDKSIFIYSKHRLKITTGIAKLNEAANDLLV